MLNPENIVTVKAGDIVVSETSMITAAQAVTEVSVARVAMLREAPSARITFDQPVSPSGAHRSFVKLGEDVRVYKDPDTGALVGTFFATSQRSVGTSTFETHFIVLPQEIAKVLSNGIQWSHGFTRANFKL
jgi:hypothetical protein